MLKSVNDHLGGKNYCRQLLFSSWLWLSCVDLLKAPAIFRARARASAHAHKPYNRNVENSVINRCLFHWINSMCMGKRDQWLITFRERVIRSNKVAQFRCTDIEIKKNWPKIKNLFTFVSSWKPQNIKKNTTFAWKSIWFSIEKRIRRNYLCINEETNRKKYAWIV